MALEDRQQLAAFLVDLHSFVAQGLDRHADDIPSQYREELAELWALRSSTIEAASVLLTAPEGFIEPETSAVDLDLLLDSAGLTGRELQLKLGLWPSYG